MEVETLGLVLSLYRYQEGCICGVQGVTIFHNVLHGSDMLVQ